MSEMVTDGPLSTLSGWLLHEMLTLNSESTEELIETEQFMISCVPWTTGPSPVLTLTDTSGAGTEKERREGGGREGKVSKWNWMAY